MPGREFRVPVNGGHLRGWVEGSGPRVLLLHGGPGISANYLDGLLPELLPGYEVAVFQQRGLAPSMEDGPFDVATHIEDVTAVLDALDWDRVYLVGHSWGGHLALHVAASLPARLEGVLAIDPVGVIGDGGLKRFQATLMERLSESSSNRIRELDRFDEERELTAAEAVEYRSLLWPAYFADPRSAPPAPDVNQVSLPAMSGGFQSMAENRSALEEALPTLTLLTGFVAGGASPMPVDEASRATARMMPNAWVEVVPDAGHFIWMEAPGAVRKALDRLTQSSNGAPADGA